MDIGDIVQFIHNDKIHGISVSGILHSIDIGRAYIRSNKAINNTVIVKGDIVKVLREQGTLTVLKPVEKETIKPVKNVVKRLIEKRNTDNLIFGLTHDQIAKIQGIEKLK